MVELTGEQDADYKFRWSGTDQFVFQGPEQGPTTVQFSNSVFNVAADLSVTGTIKTMLTNGPIACDRPQDACWLELDNSCTFFNGGAFQWNFGPRSCP